MTEKKTQIKRIQKRSVSEEVLEDQRYVLEYRRLLECEQAALAAVRAGEEDIRALRENVEKMQNTRADYTEFSQADLEFHMLPARAFGMRLIAYDPYVPEEVFAEKGVEKVAISAVRVLQGEMPYNVVNKKEIL